MPTPPPPARPLPRRLSAVALLGLLALSAGAAAATLAGCNTTAGVGEDLSAAGDGIHDAAEKAK